MIIEEDKIGMDPVKLQGITDWPLPKTVKDIQSFLGFGNYYQKFINRYGDLTTPLNKLLRKEEKFEWTPPRQLAFNTLKARFLEAPVLQIPDPLKPFMVKSDASKFASGAVLQQQDTNGDWHPYSYLSQSFSVMERNYEIYDRELLAVRGHPFRPPSPTPTPTLTIYLCPVTIRGHPFRPPSPTPTLTLTIYLHPATLDIFHPSNTLYVPPHHRQPHNPTPSISLSQPSIAS